MLDTAADAPTFVLDKDFKEYAIIYDGATGGVMGIHDGAKRVEVPVYDVAFDRFDFDKMEFKKVKARIVDIRPIPSALTRRTMHQYYNIIGLPFLKTLSAVHFDAPNSVVYFDRKKE